MMVMPLLLFCYALLSCRQLRKNSDRVIAVAIATFIESDIGFPDEGISSGVSISSISGSDIPLPSFPIISMAFVLSG